jgi:hypothetical protein
MKDPANREIGIKSLVDIYTEMTPGQKPKEEVKEDNVIPRGKFGLPKNGGLGPEYGIQVSPALVTGFANIGNSVYEASKSIREWAMNPKTQQKFAEKYGDLAEQKLIEAALRLEEAGCGCDHSKPKSVKKIKEMAFMGASGAKDDKLDTMGTVPVQVKEAKSPAWQRKEGKNPEGGLNKKGVASYRRENPGSKLQTAVTTEPSKLKKGSKKAKRRLSFCRRMKGMKKKLTSAKTARDPNSRINKSLRKWNCEE